MNCLGYIKRWLFGSNVIPGLFDPESTEYREKPITSYRVVRYIKDAMPVRTYVYCKTIEQAYNIVSESEERLRKIAIDLDKNYNGPRWTDEDKADFLRNFMVRKRYFLWTDKKAGYYRCYYLLASHKEATWFGQTEYTIKDHIDIDTYFEHDK